MVFSSVVTSIINRFLSPFVDELTANQLNIFAWSGQASLSDVSIKPNAFDALKLPFRIVHGHIGRIDASVPWMNIYSEPIVLKVSDVYVLAVPNAEVVYNEEDEKYYEWALKKKYLENIEYMKQRIKDELEGNKEDDGFLVKLLVAAIKNIQIFISNVHVVYEDSTTYRKHFFQVGFSFSELIFETELDKKSANDLIIHKLVKLEGISVYLNAKKMVKRLFGLKFNEINEILKNRIAKEGAPVDGLEYILCPNNLLTEATIHRKPEVDAYQIPIINANITLDYFRLQLTKNQIQTLMLLSNAIDRMKSGAPYRKWRPSEPIRESPILWWKFMFTATAETAIRRRKREFCWRSIESTCQKRATYKELYKQKLLGETVDTAALETLEKELHMISIVMARSQAEAETKKILELRKAEQAQSGGWFSGWWSSATAAPEKDKATSDTLKTFKKEFSTEEKTKLYKAIGYEETAQLQLYPAEFVAYRVKFSINMLKIVIREETTSLVNIELDKCHFSLLQRPSSANFFVQMELGRLTVVGVNGVMLLKGRDCEKQFLLVSFEMNPLDKQSDYAARMTMKSAYLLYDVETVAQLCLITKPPAALSAEEFQSYTQDKLTNLKQMTLLGIEFAVERHKQLKLDVAVEPSFVIVPKTGNIAKAKTVVLLSLGKFYLTSKLVPKSNTAKIHEMMADKADVDTMMEELRELVYEKYCVHIQNVQLVLSDATHWQADIDCLDTERHMICPFEVVLEIGRSIVPQNPHFAKIVFTGQVPKIEMKASDWQISSLLGLFLTLPFGSTSAEVGLVAPSKESSALQSADVSKNLKMIKMSTQNHEVADAYSYATKAVEDLEVKNSQVTSTIESNVASSTVEENKTPQKDLVFEFSFPNICMSIYAADRRAQSSLGQFQLVKLLARGELLADGKMYISCTVGDLKLEDIRQFRKETGIRTMLAKSDTSESESKSILTVNIAQKAAERSIKVTMSGFTYSFALDYMFSIIDAVTKAFTFPVDVGKSSVKMSLSQSMKSIVPAATVQTDAGVVNVIAIELDKIEIIMVESLEVPDAVACVFNCLARIDIRLDAEAILIKGGVSRIAMGVANCLAYFSTGKLEEYIMSPTEMELTGTIKGIKQTLSLIFGDIKISISPQMVNILLSIFASLGSSTMVAVNENDSTEAESTTDLLLPKPIDRTRAWFNVEPVVPKKTELPNSAASAESNQIINFSMANINVLFKSSGQSAKPLIRFSMQFFAQMADSRRLTFECPLLADYFNTALLVWEPLIEPVEERPFRIEGVLHLEESCTKVQLETTENLEVLLTKSSINLLNTIGTAFKSALSHEPGSLAKFQENRVIIRNVMGIALVVDMAKSSIEPIQVASATRQSYRSRVIKSGEEVAFTAKDMTTVELSVALQFSETQVIQRTIACSTSSVRCYFTSIKTYPLNENWKWIVQVHDNGVIKKVDFQSHTQIVNHFDNSFTIYSYDGKRTRLVGTVDAGAQFLLPLNLIYSEYQLYIRPSNDFEMSSNAVDWRSIDLHEDTDDDDSSLNLLCCSTSPQTKVKFLVLTCKHKTETKKYFTIKVRGEKVPVLYEDSGRLDYEESAIYNIKLVPFLRLKNLLPYSIQYNYDPVETEVVGLQPGDERILPYAIFGTTHITYRVLQYLGQDWICTALLPEWGHVNESLFYRFEALEGTEQICLAVNFCVEKNSLILSVFAPFWMVNQLDADIHYKVDEEHVFDHPKSLTTRPFLLAFDPEKVSQKNKLSLAVGYSHFSEPFPLNVVPYSGSFLPYSATKRYKLCVNVRVELARIGLSKIVTVSSFYNVYNISKRDIEYSEDDTDWVAIAKESSKAFFPRKSENQTMSFRFAGGEAASKHVSLRSSSQTLLPIGVDDYLFIEVNVSELEAKVKISDYFYGTAPVLVVNDLRHPILFGQKGVTDWKATKNVTVLSAKQMTFFCWIDPLAPREFIYRLSAVDKDREAINLDFDKYAMMEEAGNSGWVTFFDGKQRVLIFTTDPYLPQHLLKTDELTKPTLSLEVIMKGLGVNVVNNEKKKDLLYLTINSTCVWEERANANKPFRALSIKENTLLEELFQQYRKSGTTVEQEGTDRYEIDFTKMQMLKPRAVQLQRTSNRGLWFLYSASAHITQLHLKVNRIQVDNQLPDHIYAVAFSPVSVPKTISDSCDLQQKSFIEISAIIQSLGSVTRYKYLQVLIQEFMLQADWGWITMMMDIFDWETTKEDSPQSMIAQDVEAMMKNNTLAEMQKFVMRKTYYDYLLLGPVKAHISFSVGDLPDGKFPLGLDFIIRFTGLTVGEINDTLLKLDYFERRQLSSSDAELVQQIAAHYKTQVYTQLYKLILGLDIIGNPMKLALGITKGVGDFFYEPAMGIIHGPEEFAEGVAAGVKSLASNVLGGTAGALGRIGNRLGTGVAALTADEKFQKERRERMNRKAGFAETGKNLVRSIFDGITGVVTKPIEGAREQGVEGLFKGVGRGVVGVVVQPATGVIDFASGSLHAFNDVIDPKQVATPVRPPRHFPSGHELAPYVLYAAQGNQLLRALAEGQHASGDEYDYHLQLNPNCTVLLTKQKLFYLKKSFFTSTWETDWVESWSNCEKITNEGKKLRIRVKESQKVFFFFNGPKELTIADSNENNLKVLYTKIKRHINGSQQ